MPSDKSIKKIRRIWTAISFIAKRKNGVTIKQILEEYPASRSTLYSDLSFLVLAGVPIEKQLQNGEVRYQIKNINLPDLVPTSKTESLLRFAEEILAPLAGTNAYADLGKLPRNEVAAEGRHLSPVYFAHANERMLVEVERAIDGHRRIEIRYRRGGSEEQTRTIEPYALRLSSSVYCIAHDVERNEVRTFKVSRIEHILDVGKRTSSYQDQEIDDIFERSRGIWHGKHETIVVRLHPPVAHLAAEWPLHESQSVEEQEDGTTLITCTVQGQEEALRWALSWAGNAEIVSPKELRHRAQTLHENAAKRHRSH